MVAVLDNVSPSGRYNKSEAARLLGISRVTLDRQIAEGNIRLRAHRYTGKGFILGADIVKYFNAII